MERLSHLKLSHLKIPIVFLAAGVIFVAGLLWLFLSLGRIEGQVVERPLTQIFVPFIPQVVLMTGAVVVAVIALYIRHHRRHATVEHVQLPRHVRAEKAKPRLLFVVLDGAADKKIAALKGKTPLEAANMSALNSLAARGQMGHLEVIPGVAPESDEAVFALLGYDPQKYYTGRGVLEAIGSAMAFKDGDLALRGNFATVEADVLVDGRAGGLTTAEAKQLADFLNKKIKLDAKFAVRAGVGYRFVLLIKAYERPLSDRISNTHPGYVRKLRGGALISAAKSFERPEIESCTPLDNTEEAKRSAELVNKFVTQATKLLADHPVNAARKKAGKPPANFVLLRDASIKSPRLYDINARYGKKWAIIADMPVEVGIGKLAGMEVVRMPELSGHDAEDYALRAAKTLETLKKADCVYVHLKGPDNFAHKKDALGKMRNLEAIDKNFFAPLVKKLDMTSIVLAVTCDHATSSESGAHTAAEVPLLVYAPGIAEDLHPFNETAAFSRAHHRFIFGGHDVRATHMIADLMRLLRHAESATLVKERVERARAASLARHRLENKSH